MSMTTSEQARADAMADAETLRLNMLYGSIFDATYAMGDGWTANQAKKHAYISAQAAFRAVPGLRGDAQEEDR